MRLIEEINRLGVDEKVSDLYRKYSVGLLTYEQAVSGGFATYQEAISSLGLYNGSIDKIAINIASHRTAWDIEHTMLHELAHWTGHSSRQRRPAIVTIEQVGKMSWVQRQQLRFGPGYFIQRAEEEVISELTSFHLARELGLSYMSQRQARMTGYANMYINEIKAMGAEFSEVNLNVINQYASTTAKHLTGGI